VKNKNPLPKKLHHAANKKKQNIKNFYMSLKKLNIFNRVSIF